MRRLLVILMALSMAVSCVESQVEGGKEIQKDPVSECLVPSSARCGGEVILQWNGFTDDASVILRSDSGADEAAELQVITDSGLIFNVPWSLVPGIYKVVLIQEGEHVLGEIEILAPEMPVSSVSVPSSCLAGESVLISGTGFDASYTVNVLSAYHVFCQKRHGIPVVFVYAIKTQTIYKGNTLIFCFSLCFCIAKDTVMICYRYCFTFFCCLG